ncbi:amidohydrolase family protein [Pseudalkalibacillus sp. R45]|uniref:amidohydrolase family protein n=1 Tax=Pseudalkalibacillus sp. R45 TaxID=3457433 RepID=UPI003FCD1CBE
MAHKILIKNPLIISNEPSFGTQPGSVFVEDHQIRHILNEDDSEGLKKLEEQADEILDAQDMILIPGMVNAHYHSYTNMLKGTVNNLPLELWTLYTVAYGHSLEEEDIYYGVLLGCIEMMKSGVTSCLDHFPHIRHSDAALKAYEEAGMRVAFAPMMHDVPDEDFFNISIPKERNTSENKRVSPAEMKAFYLKLLSEWHGKEGRIHVQLGPNAPQRCSSDMLKVCKALSENEELRVHMHLLETRMQRKQSQLHYPEGMITYLNDAGLLNEKLSVAHGVWLNRDELELLADRQVSIVHNPASNLLLGSGIASIPAFLKMGGNVAIGTDGSNCGTNHNLFEAMRLAVLIHRVNQPYSDWMTAEDVFRTATTSGARIIDSHIGKIEQFHKADMVLLNRKNTFMTPFNDPISQLVHQESGTSVHSVMVNGGWTVKNKKLVSLDENRILNEVRKRAEGMFEKSTKPLARAEKLRPYFKQILPESQLPREEITHE